MDAIERAIGEHEFPEEPASSYLDTYTKAQADRDRLDAQRELRDSFCALSPDGRLGTWLRLRGVRP